MRLRVAPHQPRIAGVDLDFRDEIMAQIFDRGTVIHFNHPTWREDRNDPTTATRVEGREVR